jgi:hypothetical protein
MPMSMTEIEETLKVADASKLLESASGYSDIADDAGLLARQANDLLQEIQAQKEFLGH